MQENKKTQNERVALHVRSGYDLRDMVEKVIYVRESDLPMDVAPDMVCEDLQCIPEKGETLYLGDCGPHMYPWNVIVKRY
jgi:hypothetical protein